MDVGRDCGAQEKSCRGKQRPQLLNEQREIDFVLGGATPVRGVLPIQIQTAESPLGHEVEQIVDELTPQRRVVANLREVFGLLKPTAYADHCLQVSICLAQRVEIYKTICEMNKIPQPL